MISASYPLSTVSALFAKVVKLLPISFGEREHHVISGVVPSLCHVTHHRHRCRHRSMDTTQEEDKIQVEEEKDIEIFEISPSHDPDAHCAVFL